MDKALAMVGYDKMPAAKEAARKRGKYLGVGLSTYIEVCGVAPSKWIGAVGEGWGAAMWESGNIKVHLTGKVVVTMGTQPQGQGHETTYAQVISHELGVPMEDIVIQHSDTQGTPFGYGSYGSRTSSVGMTAAIKAADKIRDKARRYAAHMLEASPEDIEVDGANYRVKGSPDKVKTIQEIAFALDLAFDTPEGMEPYLDETAYYDTPNCTWPFGTHIAIVEIDEETGHVELVRYVAVDDVGKKINPMIVDGQLHGGIAQGVGQALWEQAVYDDQGQLLSGSMLDYTVPRASFFPNIELDETVTPSPVNPIGVKGVGEAGAIASTAAVANAVDRRARPARHPPSRHAVHAPDRLACHPGCEGRPGVIPAAFEYQRPASVDDAIRALSGARRGEGHRRRAEPAAAAQAPPGERRDARRHRPPDRAARPARAPRRRLRGRRADDLRRTSSRAPQLGWVAEAVEGIGDVQVRNRGTVGGSIAHCDPASDLPAIALALDYSAVLRSSRGERVVPLDGFFEGPFQTAIESDELLIAIRRGPTARRRRRGVSQARPAGVGLLDRRRRRGDRARRRDDRPRARCADRRGRPPVPGNGRWRTRCAGATARPRPWRRPPSTLPTARPSTATSMPTANTASRMAVVYTRRAIEAALGR